MSTHLTPENVIRANGRMFTEDRLTRSQTAFMSWQEFLAELRKGYVPTLRRTKANDKLARIVEAHGFRTFRIK
jgi:hypothetical protein